MAMKTYVGMISSDWSQCLSPNGPFDAFMFHYPHIESDLNRIFRQYTGNEISLRHATAMVAQLLPAPLTRDQMDAYLDERFEMYKGVDELIRWCDRHQVLFMINTTGFMGYFQRALAKDCLPQFAVLSAQSMLRFSNSGHDPDQMIDLFEIDDKASNTGTIAGRYHIPPAKMVLMGDSGGDGPHFKWGARMGASLIGSMTKPSLKRYCQINGIEINRHFGHTYADHEQRSLTRERGHDFAELINVIGPLMGIAGS